MKSVRTAWVLLLLAAACGKQSQAPSPGVQSPVARTPLQNTAAPNGDAPETPAAVCPTSVPMAVTPSVVDNRMEPQRGVALVRACEPCGDVNQMLKCLAGGDDFRLFEANWPRVPGFGSGHLQVDWTLRVLDAAAKGNREWKEEVRDYFRNEEHSTAPFDGTVAAELLAALDRRELTQEQIESACRVAGVDSARAEIRRRLFVVASLVGSYVAAGGRNRWD